MKRVYICFIVVMLLLLSFTFLPFGVNAEGVVDNFQALTNQSTSNHSISIDQFKHEIKVAADGSDIDTGNNIALVFPLKPNAGETVLITSFVGEDRGDGNPHAGTDIAILGATAKGHKLLSCVNGIVTLNKYGGGYGNSLVISDPKTGLYYRYAHMQDPSPITVGAKVKAGQEVGICGDTEAPGQYHLHFEIFIPPAGDDMAMEPKLVKTSSDPQENALVTKLKMKLLGTEKRYVTSIYNPEVKFLDINYPQKIKFDSAKDSFGFKAQLNKYTGSE